MTVLGSASLFDPRRHSTVAAFMVVISVLASAACSPEGGVELGQATSDDRIDPCALLTVEEIEEVLGWELPEGERPREHETDGQAVCSWEDHRSGLLHLQLHEGNGTERFETMRDELEAIGEASDTDLRGADAAWEDPSHGVVGMLVGDRFAQVALWGTQMTEAQHLRLAEMVAVRL